MATALNSDEFLSKPNKLQMQWIEGNFTAIWRSVLGNGSLKKLKVCSTSRHTNILDALIPRSRQNK